MTRATSGRRRSPRWLAAGAVALAAACVAVVAIVLAADGDSSSPSAGETGEAGEPGVDHVHGLGINPADGSLVVATHHGSFRVAAGNDDIERIGDSFQDTMGFTVAGPDHFLGSGHPDAAGLRAGQPAQLGLIESTDAGATWTALSLGGEVDFHALAFAHNQVYGWDAGTGRFMVSADRANWDTRATLDLFGFAVDPGDPDHVIAATPDGIAESTDGGRSWARVDGPLLVAISWDANGGLWGADPSGVVWHHDADGWSKAGELPGQPQAFLATADALHAAAHDEQDVTGIYESTDGGRTWNLRYRDGVP